MSTVRRWCQSIKASTWNFFTSSSVCKSAALPWTKRHWLSCWWQTEGESRGHWRRRSRRTSARTKCCDEGRGHLWSKKETSLFTDCLGSIVGSCWISTSSQTYWWSLLSECAARGWTPGWWPQELKGVGGMSYFSSHVFILILINLTSN